MLAIAAISRVHAQCADQDTNCPLWAAFNNQCRIDLVRNMCPVSCNACPTTTGCTPNPCQNQGVCVPLTTGTTRFRCDCRFLYSGTNCQTLSPTCADSDPNNQCASFQAMGACFISFNRRFMEERCPRSCGFCANPCLGNPCQNAGQCAIQGTSYLCTCPAGFTGVRCELAGGPCNPSPCQNNGVCSVVGNTFRCTCVGQFSGPTCATPATNPCLTTPCLNGGQCFVSGTGRVCQCPTGFSGNNCEIQAGVCTPTTCANGGSCRTSPVGSALCDCLPGFVGTRCQLDTCNPNPCNLGTCTRVPGNFRCTCPAGVTSPTCVRNLCQPNPCQNNGVCSLVANGFQCTCPQGITGNMCQIGNNCAGVACLNGGRCVVTGTTARCACPNGYVGVRCETFTLCDGNPCRPGMCMPSNTGYQCRCLDGAIRPTSCPTAPVSTCVNRIETTLCDELADDGFCTSNAQFMVDNCALACRICGPNELCRDLNNFCPGRAMLGDCTRFADYMTRVCRRSCGVCGMTGPVPPTTGSCMLGPGMQCRDTQRSCQVWANARNNLCRTYPNVLNVICPQACRCC